MNFRIVLGLAWCALLIVLTAGNAFSRDIISLPNKATSLELGPTLERIEQGQPELRLKTAPDGAGTSYEIIVDAKGRGPIYRWIAFALRNVSQKPLEYDLATQRSGFSGSGFYTAKSSEKPIIAIRASTGTQPVITQTAGNSQKISIVLLPGQTITYVAELSGNWPHTLTLWKKGELQQRVIQEAFLKGLLLGIAALVAIYISTLFIVRRKLMFPVSALFALSAVAFICGEFGFLPSTFGIVSITDEVFRATTEAVMSLSLFGFLLSFLELRQRVPAIGYAVIGIVLVSFGNVILSFYMPAEATYTARIGMLVAVLGGCWMVFTMARQRFLRAQAIVPFWAFITIWTLGAGAVSLNLVSHNLTLAALIGGLVIVLLTLAFTVTQFAFTANLMSDGVYDDSGRKALALAGSQQSVWDWDEEGKRLYVGRELEAMLGLKTGHINSGGADAWLELVHSEDRSIYSAAVEAAVERGQGVFSVEFRMQRADGSYRWFLLRARAVPSDTGQAQRCIGTLSDITDIKTSEERLLHDAVHDHLTRLPNHALFLDRLERALLRINPKNPYPLAIFAVDLDRFKNVNDGLGRAMGDSLLLEMSRRLSKLIGPQDTVARLGGAQFAIISVSVIDAREITTMAERIRRAMSAPVLINNREVYLTASIGVARYSEPGVTAQELLKDAEVALHYAKRQGKDKIEFFRPSMRDERGARVSLEADLRNALDNKEIEIAYQPIVRLSERRVAGFEALLRWQHPRLGLLAPSDFIDIAEESGLIVDLGRFVLEQSSRQLGTWQRAFTPKDPIFISINVSSRQLLTGVLVDDLKSILERAELVPNTLKLEITESLIMENPEQSVKILRRLKELGASLSIDDFGTGYSSLSYLQRFPFDTIKIDQSFVQSGNASSATTIIMESIIKLAENLNMEVVAEGAETAQDVEMLKQAGCEYAQGFYFGQPMSSKEALEYFSARASKWGTRRKVKPAEPSVDVEAKQGPRQTAEQSVEEDAGFAETRTTETGAAERPDIQENKETQETV